MIPDEIHTLAKSAIPIDDADWGSERQIAAQNEFYDAVLPLLKPEVREQLEIYCLKATTGEGVNLALSLVSRTLAG